MSDITTSNDQEFISGENLYFEYKGSTKVEVKLNAVDEDYPISRVIKQDVNGDVIVQGIDQTGYPNGGNLGDMNDITNEQFEQFQTTNGNHHYNHYHDDDHHSTGNNGHHSHHHHSHMDAIGKQGDIIRDQINRSMNKNLLCDFEYADDLDAMKTFWLALPTDKKKDICKIESSEVLKVIQEDPKASCSCKVCGNRKITLERELQKLYIGYYSIRKLASDSLDECELNINLVNNIFGIPTDKSIEPPKSPDQSTNAMDSIMSVADDLVKNNGENFINLIEQLHNSNRNQSNDDNSHHELDQNQLHNLFQNPPEPHHFQEFNTKSNKIEELPNDNEVYEEQNQQQQQQQPTQEVYDSEGEDEYYDEDEELKEREGYEFDDQYLNESDQVTRKRLEETYKMLQFITARVLRIKVYEAFKAKKADDISMSLLDEFAKEEEKLKEKEERQKRKREKEKERKRLQRLAKEEEKKRQEDELLEKERRDQEEHQKKMEEGRKRKEAEKKKVEEDKKRKEEEKKRKKTAQLEKLREEKDDRERKKKEKQELLKLKQEKESKNKKKLKAKLDANGLQTEISNESSQIQPQPMQLPIDLPQIQPPILPFTTLPQPSVGASDQFSGFTDQNSMIHSLMNSLPQSQSQPQPQPQPSYPFLSQSSSQPPIVPGHIPPHSSSNMNWGMNPLGDFQTNGMVPNIPFNANKMNGVYDTNVPPLQPNGNINTQGTSGMANGSPFLNSLFNPLATPTVPHTSSIDNLYGSTSEIWNNGRSPSVTSSQIHAASNAAVDISPVKDISGLTSRQGSIWGLNSTPIAPAPPTPSWDPNMVPLFITEMIQREALNASFKLPKLPHGGYSIQLMFGWVKQILDASYPNLTISQFIQALNRDMEGKIQATFQVSRGTDLNEMVVFISQDSLIPGFSGISLMDNFSNGFPNASSNGTTGVWSSQL